MPKFDQFKAYKAMFSFIEHYYKEINRPSVLGDMLSDMSMTNDYRKTSDPAMWAEWLEAIKRVEKESKKARN